MVNHTEIIAEIIMHATEDKKKFFDPMYEVFEIKEEQFMQERLEGHFGNPILMISIKLGKKRAEEFIKKLVSKISKSQMNEFIETVIRFAAENLNYIIPYPNEQSKLFYDQ